MAEVWKPIPGIEGYDVSDHGRVRSYWRVVKGRPPGKQWDLAETPQRIMSTNRKSGGYPITIINGQVRHVHRLVMEAFVGPLPDGLQTCHNDGNRKNNHLSNLRYDTPKANMADAIALGTVGPGFNRKLTEKQIVTMREMGAAGTRVKQLAKKFGVCTELASSICKGEIYDDCGGPIVKALSRNPRKLTKANAASIRKRVTYTPQAILAKEYGVSISLISRIKSGERHGPLQSKETDCG